MLLLVLDPLGQVSRFPHEHVSLQRFAQLLVAGAGKVHQLFVLRLGKKYKKRVLR